MVVGPGLRKQGKMDVCLPVCDKRNLCSLICFSFLSWNSLISKGKAQSYLLFRFEFIEISAGFLASFSQMGSSDRLFNRQRSLHQIFGGGLLADIILWRRNNLTVGILLVTLAAWVVFEISGYTLLSLVSSVLLLLLVILFLWAKSAAILNRPAPPLPDLQLSEEIVDEVACFILTRVNNVLSASQDIALGRNSRLFLRVAACLCLISFIGGLTDFQTLSYTSLLVILTVPAIYERYENHVDGYLMKGYRKLHQFYVTIGQELVSRFEKLTSEKEKLS